MGKVSTTNMEAQPGIYCGFCPSQGSCTGFQVSLEDVAALAVLNSRSETKCELEEFLDIGIPASKEK